MVKHMKLTITLSPEQLAEAVAAYVANLGYKAVGPCRVIPDWKAKPPSVKGIEVEVQPKPKPI